MSSFRKAVRRARNMRMAIDGVAGSGKTRTALEIMCRIAKRVAVIDSEHSSADTYAPKAGEVADMSKGTFDFDTCPLENFAPDTYIAKLHEAAAEGFDGVIVDSLSHAWMGEGGILSQADAAKGNFNVWKNLTPQQNRLMAAILSYPGHVIVTLRTKTVYEVTQVQAGNGKEKTKVEKVGTAPVQKEGMEFEFDVIMDIDIEHDGAISKSRCSEIEGRTYNKPGAEFAAILKRWLDAGEGEPLAPKAPAAAPVPPAAPQRTAQQVCAAIVTQIRDAAGQNYEGKLRAEVTNLLNDTDPAKLDTETAKSLLGTQAAPGPLRALRDAVVAGTWGRAPAAPEKSPATVHPISPACEALLATIRTSLDVIEADFPAFAEQARKIVTERSVESMPEAGLRAVKLALDAVYAQAVAA